MNRRGTGSRSNPVRNLFSVDNESKAPLFFAIFEELCTMKVYQHIVFWVTVYLTLTLVFASWFDGYVEAFYYVSLLMPVVL